jgi:enoyl-CoA hydratase
VFVDEQLAGADRVSAVVVRGDVRELVEPGSLPVVVAWVGDRFGGTGPAAADVVVGEDDVAAALASIERSPLTAATLAVLLRSIVGVTVDDGLAMESAAYSVLQAGPEFAAWRAGAPHVADTSADHAVAVERRGDELLVTLDRPHRHNAITAQLRDELHAALTVAAADDSVTSVVLRGNGPSFSSGGDLGEFGTRSDPATAHITRLARSPSRLIHQLRDKTTARIHGAALGGGIELAAFAGRVVAHPDTVVALPEIELGLIPGAGGTVSLTRRIGRRRTAALALTGRRIDAATALAWRLVDELERT